MGKLTPHILLLISSTLLLTQSLTTIVMYALGILKNYIKSIVSMYLMYFEYLPMVSISKIIDLICYTMFIFALLTLLIALITFVLNVEAYLNERRRSVIGKLLIGLLILTLFSGGGYLIGFLLGVIGSALLLRKS